MGADGTMVCPLLLKKSKNVCLTSAAVILSIEFQRIRQLKKIGYFRVTKRNYVFLSRLQSERIYVYE